MSKFRKKPIVIEAQQWLHDAPHFAVTKYGTGYTPNGFCQPECQYCHGAHWLHGWIETLEGGHVVCPNDWIITGVKGEHYPCKPDIFDATYEAVESDTGAAR